MAMARCVSCSHPSSGKQLPELLNNIVDQESTLTKIFARFMKDESGATAIEYGLIAALISVALITGATTLGKALNNQFDQISKNLNYTK